MSDISAIEAKLATAAQLMFDKDIAIVDELWSDGFRMIGSEVGEIAATRDELERQITKIFANSFKLRWIWNDKAYTFEGDIAWVFAQGYIEFVSEAGSGKVDYRLVAIFRRTPDGWTWRLYSGSEPEPARPLS